MDEFTKALYGQHAIHIPLNIVVQGSPKEPMAVVIGQSYMLNTPHPLLFGSNKTHQLILGDAIIRPHIVIESSAFRGHGLSGLMTMSPTEWLENPHGVLLNMTGDVDKRLKR